MFFLESIGLVWLMFFVIGILANLFGHFLNYVFHVEVNRENIFTRFGDELLRRCWMLCLKLVALFLLCFIVTMLGCCVMVSFLFGRTASNTFDNIVFGLLKKTAEDFLGFPGVAVVSVAKNDPMPAKIFCPSCDKRHIDLHPLNFSHSEHFCEHCGEKWGSDSLCYGATDEEIERFFNAKFMR